jgi:hypothetical protein
MRALSLFRPILLKSHSLANPRYGTFFAIAAYGATSMQIRISAIKRVAILANISLSRGNIREVGVRGVESRDLAGRKFFV